MIVLTEKDKEILCECVGYISQELNLGCGTFFCKKALFEADAFSELLGKRLADIFNIKNPYIKIQLINKDYYILSESLKNLGFKSAFHLGLGSNNRKFNACSLVDIGCFIDTFPNSLELMFNIIKVYIYDILFSNDDRSLENWGFCISRNKIEITIMDNENILNPYYNIVFGNLHASLKYKELTIYEDFELFLQEFGSIYLNLVAYYFEFITPSYFNQLVDSIDEENIFNREIKERYKSAYFEHYQSLKSIYDKFLGRRDKNAR